MRKTKNDCYVKRRKTASVNIILAIFCVAILLTSGISLTTLPKNDTQTTTSDTIIQKSRENVGNTGYKCWYHYIENTINTANGNLYYTTSDVVIPARGFTWGLEIVRTYNSHRNTVDTGFGYGWTFNYNVQLVENPDDSVTLIEGDGAVSTFISIGQGNYTAPPGIPYRLNKYPDGTFTLWCRKGKQWNFNTTGALLDIEDKNGNHLTMHYSDEHLVSVTDDSGLYLSFEYTPENNICRITDPLGRSTGYQYDANGNLVNVTDPLGNISCYAYDNAHLLLGIVDRGGRVATFEHTNISGTMKVTKVGNSLYDYTTHSYPPPYTVITVTYETAQLITVTIRGVRTEIQLNENGNPTRITSLECGCGETTMEWDSSMNLLSKTDENANTWTYQYDSYGNKINITSPSDFSKQYGYRMVDTEAQFLLLLDNTTDEEGYVTSYRYDEHGNERELIDYTGNSTQYSYDSYGYKISERNQRGYFTNYTYDIHGTIHTMTDAYGGITTYEHDLGGRLISVTNQKNQTMTYHYDLLNRLIKTRDPTGNETLYTYDSLGNLLSQTDPNGNTINYGDNFIGLVDTYTDPSGNITTYQYDKQGNLISSTDADGHQITYTYDELRRVTTITDELGFNEEYTYDSVGNHLTTKDKNGFTTTYQYNEENQVVKIIDPLHGEKTITYDPRGNIIAITDENNHASRQTYDGLNRLSSETDPSGNTTWYNYDATGNLHTVTQPNGATLTFQYDALNRISSMTDQTGNTTTYSYDGASNLQSVTNARSFTTVYEHDVLDRLIMERDPSGNETRFVYDSVGNLVNYTDVRGYWSQYEYDNLNRLIRSIDPRGNQVRYRYDADGNLLEKTDENNQRTTYYYNERGQLANVIDAKGNTTTYTYDPVGNIDAIINSRGYQTTYAYDELSRVIETRNALNQSRRNIFDAAGNIIQVIDERGFTTNYTYDANNQLITTTDPLGNTTLYSYDSMGNIIMITDPNNLTWTYDYTPRNQLQKTISPPPTSAQTTYEYDEVGNLVQWTNANQQSETYDYNEMNRVTTITDPMGYTVHYRYDPQGNILERQDKNGFLTTYAYDPVGNILQVSGPTSYATYTYDGRGNQLTRTDGNFAITTYQYDELNRLLSTSYPDGSQNRYTYDEDSNTLQIQHQGAPFETTTYQYDPLDQISRKTVAYGPFTKTIDYTYDDAGNLLSTLDSEAQMISYTYDPLNRIQTLMDSLGLLTTYTYDPGSRVSEVAYPNGDRTTYDYNEQNLLTDMMVKKATEEPLSWYHCTYDAVGNRLSTSSPESLYEYEYDDLNRLETVTVNDVSPTQYFYDPGGNRLTKTVNGIPTNYVYYNNQLFSDGPNTYFYDNNGNLIFKTEQESGTTQYAYDFENRLTMAVLPNGSMIQYQYSAEGDRLISDINGQRTYYLYEGENLLKEYDMFGITQASYVHASTSIDQPISLQKNGIPYYYHYDPLGSVSLLTSFSEEPAAQYSYDEFGIPVDGFSTVQNPYRYTGRFWEDLTKLYDNRARHYDPKIGRFIQRDPLGETEENSYIYTENNPINYIDPWGLKGTTVSVRRQEKGPYPVWYATPQGVAAVTAGNTGPLKGMPIGGLTDYFWIPDPPQEPVYDGKQLCGQTCCWIKEPGKLNLVTVPKTVAKGKQDNTNLSLNENAANAINRHERKHAKLAEMAFNTFAGPLKKRMENYQGQDKGYKMQGGTIAECIQKLKDIIRFQDTVNKIYEWMTKLDQRLDSDVSKGGDAGYLNLGGATNVQKGTINAKGLQDQAVRHQALQNKAKNDLKDDLKKSGLDKEDGPHGRCVACPGPPHPTTRATQPPLTPVTTPGPVPPPNPTPQPTPEPTTTPRYPYARPYPVATLPDLNPIPPYYTSAHIYFLPENDAGVGEPTNIKTGDYFNLGDHDLFVTITNHGDYPVVTDVDFTLEREGTLPVIIDHEGFDDPVWFPPQGWQLYHLGSQNPWKQDWVLGHNSPASATVSTIWPPTPPLFYNEWLVTEQYDFGEINSPTLTFWNYNNWMWPPPNFNCGLQLWITTDGGFTPSDFLTDGTLLFDLPVLHTPTWMMYPVGLSAYAGESNIHLAFVVTGENTIPPFNFIEVLVDDITIQGIGSGWQQVETVTNGPYELNPDRWIQSFFDIFFETEGNYRATFALDQPLRGRGWIDDDAENNIYQASFTVIDDTLPPIISNVQAMPPLANIGGSINISCNVEDNIGVKTVRGYSTYPDGSLHNHTLQHVASSTTYYFNTTYTLPGSYSYYIWASDLCDNSISSSTYNFAINYLPALPSNPNPQNNSIGVSITADISWSASIDPDGDLVTYDVYFGTTQFPPKITSNQTATTYNLPTLSYNTLYYWRIVAWDVHGASARGPLWNFYTQDNQLLIDGDCFYLNMTPVNTVSVEITNLNTGRRWQASTNNNHYSLSLIVGQNVNASETLRYIARDTNESVNVTDHLVTTGEINAGAIHQNLILKVHYRDLKSFPWYLSQVNTGAMTMKMMMDYLMWNSTTHPQGPPSVYSEQTLYNTYKGTDNIINGTELSNGLNAEVDDIHHNWMYGYFFNPFASTNVNDVLKQICVWLDYPVNYYNNIRDVDVPKQGHPNHVPIAVPTGGNYNSWMVVRGIHSDRNAWLPPAQLNVYGFWLNDPKSGGLGANTYVTASRFLSTYFQQLNVPGDAFNGQYLAITDPSRDISVNADDVQVRFMETKATLTQKELAILKSGISINNTLSSDILIKAAYSQAWNVLKNDVKYSSLFADAKTLGKPTLFKGEYLIKFDSNSLTFKVTLSKVADLQQIQILGIR